MDLIDIVRRTVPPGPWAEGDNIPWDEPAFSERMLAEHLRQDHDAASRPATKIDEHVRWIHGDLLEGRPARILDLACGPGLYTSRLATLGHRCAGIDFAPAAVAYAQAAAAHGSLDCTYALADLRDARFGEGFGLVMLISGQLNVFRRPEAKRILERVFAALDPGGILLLEPERFATVVAEGEAPPTWYSAPSGLFSASPHLCLSESSWDAAARTSTRRFFIVDAATGVVTRHALSNEAYADDEYLALVAAAGFEDARILPSLVGVKDKSQAVNLVVVARKPGA